MPTPGLCAVATKYGKYKNIPVVIDVVDMWPDIFLDVFPNWIRPFVKMGLFPLFLKNRILFQKATAIYGVSRTYLDWGIVYSGRAQNKKTDKVFPLGYEELSLNYKQVCSEKKYLQDKGVAFDKLICCYFGQLESTYDVETILEAATILKQTQFVLCGLGSKMNFLLNMAKKLDNVLFLGWVAPTTLNVLMRLSAVGLATYTKNAPQSLPYKPFEYFSGGLPVISSLHYELEQILSKNDCGLTYEAGDAQSLVNAILYLQNNSEKRAQMGKNARRLFEEKYSADKIYPAMADHMEGIVSAKDREMAT